ncbi:MAG: SDR family oxidoreductase [Xanthomonadales bacterium]|nr:SDR family oxidoreductase [Xanthomonadales bacterium]
MTEELPERWSLRGQTALIAGASRGIGLACARELAALGADLLLVAREREPLEAAAEELAERFPARRVRLLAADLADGEQRLELFDWLTDLGAEFSLLVNNVGDNLTRPALAFAEAEWRRLFELNVFASFELSRLAHPWLARHPASAVVNVGSVAGLVHVGTGAPYAMAKAALHQMTRSLACEWAADGIRVNAVAPWYVRTRRTAPALADPDYREAVLARTPLARIGEPEEVAAAVAFLCLPAARWITGQVLAVDGGFSAYGF